MLNFLKFLAYPIFKILFAVEYHGLDNIPQKGPVILAGNHPSYLDPLLIALPVKRVIRYMAWDALFKIPLLGLIIRMLGAFPVDIRKGKGESAFQEACRVLQNGDALGIFPEGQRSAAGPMGELKTGTARLALETGAPIVPITIGGAFRAWPKFKFLPKPARVIVRYHKPIFISDLDRVNHQSDREFHTRVMNEVAVSINRSLKPNLRGDAQFEQWYKQPPSNIRIYEWVPLIAASVSTIILLTRDTFFSNWMRIWLPPIGYYLYLVTDLMWIKPSRFPKWARNSMPVWLILIWHHPLTEALAIPAGEKNSLLITVALAAFFAFFWEDYFTLQKFVRGLVATYYLSLTLLLNWTTPLGVFIAILVFILAFCFWYRTIYYWATIGIVGIAIAVVICTSPNAGWILLCYAALGVSIIGYLQTFVNAAYDIRKEGTVKEVTSPDNVMTS